MKSLATRLAEKYVVNADTGCWQWTASTSNKRDKWVYGLISVRGALQMAHRVMYELARGPVPDGLELDHVCRNTRCINPDHLEAVTHKENIARSANFQASKTECVNGHALSGENLYVKPNGCRECRTCRKDQWRRYKERHAI